MRQLWWNCWPAWEKHTPQRTAASWEKVSSSSVRSLWHLKNSKAWNDGIFKEWRVKRHTKIFNLKKRRRCKYVSGNSVCSVAFHCGLFNPSLIIFAVILNLFCFLHVFFKKISQDSQSCWKLLDSCCANLLLYFVVYLFKITAICRTTGSEGTKITVLPYKND